MILIYRNVREDMHNLIPPGYYFWPMQLDGPTIHLLSSGLNLWHCFSAVRVDDHRFTAYDAFYPITCIIPHLNLLINSFLTISFLFMYVWTFLFLQTIRVKFLSWYHACLCSSCLQKSWRFFFPTDTLCRVSQLGIGFLLTMGVTFCFLLTTSYRSLLT